MLVILGSIVVGVIAAYGLWKFDQAVDEYCDCGEDDCGFYLLEAEESDFH